MNGIEKQLRTISRLLAMIIAKDATFAEKVLNWAENTPEDDLTDQSDE